MMFMGDNGVLGRESIASELDRLSKYAGQEHLAILVALAEDIRGTSGRHLDSWTSANIWQVLNPEQLFHNPSKLRVAGWLEDLASVVIFFPVALTWFTLWRASLAFQEYINVNPTSKLTFFELWQSGFGGILDSDFRFARYVQMSVLAILLLAGIYLLRGRLIARAEALSRQQTVEWHSVMARLDLLLSRERSENPKRFEGLLERSATELRSLLASGNQLVEAIGKEVGTIHLNIDAVTSASDALRQTIAGVSEAQAAQAQVFSAIYSSIQRIGNEIEKIPVNLGESIQGSFMNVNAVLEATVGDFTRTMTRNIDEIEKVMKSLASLQSGYIARGDILSQKLASMLAEIPGLRGRIEMSTMSSQADLAQAISVWSPNTASTLTTGEPGDIDNASA